MTKEQYEYLANQIFLSSLEVHKNLGPGLLESVYEFAFLKEMELKEYFCSIPGKSSIIL